MAKAQHGRPTPGDVVLYPFLWSHLNVSSHGSIMTRPCVVLHTGEVEDGALEVLLVPVTHTKQQYGSVGIEVPREMRPLMGLDDRASYVIISEANTLDWTAPETRLIGRVPRSFHRTLSCGVADMAEKRRLMHTEIRAQADEVRRHLRRRT